MARTALKQKAFKGKTRKSKKVMPSKSITSKTKGKQGKSKRTTSSSKARTAAKKAEKQKRIAKSHKAIVSSKKSKSTSAIKPQPARGAGRSSGTKSSPTVVPLKSLNPAAGTRTPTKKSTAIKLLEDTSKKPPKTPVAKLAEEKARMAAERQRTAKIKTEVQKRTSEEVSHKTRYSDQELEEFKKIILEKLEAARNDLRYLQEQIQHKGENQLGEVETTFASSDDSSTSMEREYLMQMAARQRLYIDHLEKALVRIQNKTYGICRVTGKLIEKERLIAVPHATLSIEAKRMQGQLQSQQVV